MILVFRLLYLSVSSYEAYNFGKYIFFNMSRSWIETKMEFVLKTGYIMTLYSLASVQIFSSLFSMHTVWCCQGNLFENQQLYNLMIISFIPMILMFGSAVIRWGEVKCQTLLGVKGLKNTSHLAPNLPPPLKKETVSLIFTVCCLQLCRTFYLDQPNHSELFP